MSKLKQRILFSIMFCAILIVAVVGIKLFSTNIKATPSAEDNLGIAQVEGDNFINFEYIPGVEGKATTTKVFRYGFCDPNCPGRKTVMLKSGPTNTSNVTIKYASTEQVSNGADVVDSIAISLGLDYCPGVELNNTDYPTQYIYIIVSVNDSSQPASVVGNVEWRYGYGGPVAIWVYNSTGWVCNSMVLSSVNSADEIPRYGENITSASVTDNGMIEYGFIGWGVATDVDSYSLSMGGIMYNAWDEYLTYPFSGFDGWTQVIAIYGVKAYHDASGQWSNFFNNLYETTGDAVLRVRADAMMYEAPRNLILPERGPNGYIVGSILSYAFSANSCIEVLHLGGVSTIEPYAFSDCSSTLRAVVWGSSQTLTIGNNAFEYAGIKVVDLSSATGTAQIYANAFRASELCNITLPPNIQRIESLAFDNCIFLREITIPGSVRYIGRLAFQDSGLYNAYFEDPIGWFVSGSTYGAAFVDAAMLAESAVAADYLCGQYNYEQYNWYSVHDRAPIVTNPEGNLNRTFNGPTGTSVGSYRSSYVSGNAGVSNSYAVSHIIFYATAGQTLSVTIMSDGENNYDYALVSKLDTSLSLSSTADTSGVHYSLKGLKGEDTAFKFDISTTGYHFVTIKYIKDGSVNDGTDKAYFNYRII